MPERVSALLGRSAENLSDLAPAVVMLQSHDQGEESDTDAGTGHPPTQYQTTYRISPVP
jgi:hypothetical protein